MSDERLLSEGLLELAGVNQRLRARVAELDAALAYVVAWMRHGEGNESTAAEMADAALADPNGCKRP